MALGIALTVVATMMWILKIGYVAITPAADVVQLVLILFDALTWFVGGFGLLLLGAAWNRRQSDREQAPFGKSAFSRARALYQALVGFQQSIDDQLKVLEDEFSSKPTTLTIAVVRMAFTGIKRQVGEQVRAASDSMEDWQSAFPVVVDKIVNERRVELLQANDLAGDSMSGPLLIADEDEEIQK
jgi:hypothetical protein